MDNLIEKIQNTNNKLSKKEAKEILESIREEIIDSLNELEVNESFNLFGLGKFKRVLRKEKLGVNPKTKERIIIPEKEVIKFKVSKKLL